ncbi:MAG TPA: hypothetical protein VFX64_06520 [Candidatus Nitrosotalea sp.]|nr:hypothetical protein [Candidatus Nitrosotalea sp.]
MKKIIHGIFVAVLVSLAFGASPVFATGQFLQMPIRVAHGPTICAIEPQANAKFPTVGKQLLDETGYAVIDWKTKLNEGLGRHPVWNITLVEVPLGQQKGFDYAKCDITIHYFPQPPENPNGFIATGVTIPNFETGKTNIEIYYQDIQSNWVKTEWTENGQGYYSYIDKPYYTGLVATSTQLDSTIRHEMGHSFGLGHYIVPYDRLQNIINGLEDMPSIMIDTVTVLGVKHYDITPLDIAQIKSIYGSGGFDNQVKQTSGYQRVHEISTDKQWYQPGERVVLNLDTNTFGEKSFAEIIIIDSNNTMVANIGISKTNSTISLDGKYQKNEKYLAELINPITGDFDFTSFSIGVPSQIQDTNQVTPTSLGIPSWVKDNARQWSMNASSDDEFVKGLEYFSSQKIITQIGSSHVSHVPNWLKKNAGLWASGQISDDEFVRGLQYLSNNKIISIQ